MLVVYCLIQWKLGEQGEELKKMIGAVTYIECSSKTQQVPYFCAPFILEFTNFS